MEVKKCKKFEKRGHGEFIFEIACALESGAPMPPFYYTTPYVPAFGLNTERYSVFSPNKGKYRPEKTTYLDTFHAVYRSCNLVIF